MSRRKMKCCVPPFALSAIAFNLFFVPALADDHSPFSLAPLHLLNPGQTEMVTHTVTHTVSNTDYKTLTTTTTQNKAAKPNIMLYLDNSDSMLGNGGKEAVIDVAEHLLPQYADKARWGLTFMNGRDTPYSWATSYHPNIPISDNQSHITSAIKNGFSTILAGYATPTIQGYIVAAESLIKDIKPENACAKNYLVVMSDGAANGGPHSAAPALGTLFQNQYYDWDGYYRSGFIPINAILNNTKYVKEVFPKYPVDNQTKAHPYQFLCPKDQHMPVQGLGYCPHKDGHTEFVMYPYTGSAELYAASKYNVGWRYIHNGERGKNWGDITTFPNNSDYSRARWYSNNMGGTSAAKARIAFNPQAAVYDAPDMMRWLSKPWYDNDLRPDLKGKQNITTFTIGFSEIFKPNRLDDYGRPMKTLPHYKLMENGASDKPGGGKWFANANNAQELKDKFKEVFDFIVSEQQKDEENAGKPITTTSSSSESSSSSAVSGGTIKRQTYSTQTPGQVGSGLTTGYPDAMASLQLNEKLTGTELIFTKLDEFGNPINDDTKGQFVGAKFSERRAMISKGDGTAQWFETPTGWSNRDFGLTQNTPEYQDTLLPWLARYADDLTIQAAAKAKNYEVNPYRVREIPKERNMGDVLDTGIVSIGKRTAESVHKNPTDNTGRKEFLLTAANDGLVYLFQNEKNANIADTPPYSLKLNYSPATMPRSAYSDTVGSKFAKIAREDYSDSANNPHLYLINGGITARRTDSGTLDKPRERQIFMAGNMGQGARGMYVLNVGGKDMKTGNPVGIDAPQHSWLNSVPLFEASAKDDNGIGYTVGFPQIARVGVNVHLSGSLKTGISQAVFMGSGFAYPNIKDQETALYVYDALGKDVGTDNIGANGRVSGSLIAKVKIGHTGGLSTPAILDVNTDGVADYAFAGDYAGNMYRFDLRDINHISYTKIYSTSSWSGSFPAQPITAEPAISKLAEGKFVVIWGTGSDIYDADFEKKEVQGLFGIHQAFDLRNELKPFNPITGKDDEVVLTRSDLLTQNLSFIADGGGDTYRMVSNNDIYDKGSLKYAGWYIPLNTITGERVVVKPDEIWGSVAIYTRFYRKQNTSGDTNLKPIPWNDKDPTANGWTKVGQTQQNGKDAGELSCALEKDKDGKDIVIGAGWSPFSPVDPNANGTSTSTQSDDECGSFSSTTQRTEQRTCQFQYTETDTYQWSKTIPYVGGSAVIQLRSDNGGQIIHKKNIGFKFLRDNADANSYMYGVDNAYISSKIYPDSINTISIFSQNITDFSQNHAGQHRSGDDETLGNLTRQPYNCLQSKPNLGYIAGSEGYKETVELGEVYCEQGKTIRRISWREIF